MLEKTIRGSQRYWGWLLFLLVLMGIGLGVYLYQFFVGLKITGMSRDVSWGFYIAQLTYLVGVAAGGVMVVLPMAKVTGALLDTEAMLQLSSVTGFPRFRPVAEHVSLSAETVRSAGAVIVGSWSSVTVTTCSAVALFPLPSVTVHVTVVFPSGKVAGALFVTEATEQLSSVAGVPSCTFDAVQISWSATTETACGAVIVGLW